VRERLGDPRIDLDQRKKKTKDLRDTMTQLGFLPMVVFEHGPHMKLWINAVEYPKASVVDVKEFKVHDGAARGDPTAQIAKAWRQRGTGRRDYFPLR
jgi:hypothetical protein